MLLSYVDGTAEALLVKRREVKRSAKRKCSADGREQPAEGVAAGIESDDRLLRAFTRNARKNVSGSDLKKEVGFSGSSLNGVHKLHRSGDLLSEQRLEIGGGSKRLARDGGDHAAIKRGKNMR